MNNLNDGQYWHIPSVLPVASAVSPARRRADAEGIIIIIIEDKKEGANSKTIDKKRARIVVRLICLTFKYLVIYDFVTLVIYHTFALHIWQRTRE